MVLNHICPFLSGKGFLGENLIMSCGRTGLSSSEKNIDEGINSPIVNCLERIKNSTVDF